MLIDRKEFLEENTYPFFGTIERINKKSNVKNLITFSQHSILTKKSDYILNPGDKISVFKDTEISNIVETLIKNQKIIGNNVEKDIQDKVKAKDNISQINSQVLQNSVNFDNSSLVGSFGSVENKVLEDNNTQKNMNEQKQDTVSKQNQIYDIEDNKKNVEFFGIDSKIFPKNLISLIKGNLVEVKGEVVFESFYPIGEPMEYRALIDQSLGFTKNADIKNIEITNNTSEEVEKNIILPGGRIFVPSIFNEKSNITITGAVENTRTLGFSNGISLKDLFHSRLEFKDNAYLYFGIIESYYNIENQKSFQAFSPIEVISGKQNINLSAGDKVRIFSKKEIEEYILKLDKTKTSQTPDLDMQSFPYIPKPASSITELIKRLLIRVEGAISESKNILLANNYSLKDIISISGGFSESANVKNIQIISPTIDDNGSIKLKETYLNFENLNSKKELIFPGSVIRIPNLESDYDSGFIKVEGAIKQQGEYRIKSGDTIYSILLRTGGFKDQAYAKGIIFSRQDEKLREEKSIKRLRRELNKSIAMAIETETDSSQVNSESIVALRELVIASSDFEPIGRVVGDFDSLDVLKTTKVKDGDRIFIPTKPTSITIVGEVMTPGSMLWKESYGVEDYIKSAAGFTDLAEKNKIFIISPTGKAETYSGFWGSGEIIFPGSVIVVPRRIKLSSTLGKVSAITSVVYQLTLTLAGIDNLLSD